MSEQEEAFPEFYTVLPNKLLAGNYPNAWDDEELRGKLRKLLKYDVTFFLDLTEDGEDVNSYLSLLKEEADILGKDIEYQRISIPDNEVPTIDGMKHILDIIDAAIEKNCVVYVHCCFGVGPTGTVTGCYLVRHGMTGEQALNHLIHLRARTVFDGMDSPSSAKQKEMVKSWLIGT